MGDRDAVPSLLGHLDDPSLEVRSAIVIALGRIGDDRAVVPLLGKVQDASVDVRRMAVRVLGDLGDARASSALMLALRDKADEVRIEAIDSLGRLRAVDATSALAPLTQDRVSPMVRDAAVEALGRIATDQAIDALMAALEQDDPYNEKSVVRRALEGVGTHVIPRLTVAVAQSSHPNVVSGATLVLGGVGTDAHVPVIVGVMQRGKVPSRVGLRALAKVGSSSALPYVLELLDAPTLAVRRAAMDAAEALLDPTRRDGRPVDPIVARLSAKDLSVEERIALTRLLGKTGAPRASTALSSLLKSGDLRLKLAATAALGDIGPAGQDAVLLEALSDTEPSVRLASAVALSRVSSPATASVLLHRLTVASEQDRAALGIALSGAFGRADAPSLVDESLRVMPSVRPEIRDVLVEGLGRMRTAAAGSALASIATTSLSVDDRRKVAEALAGHPLQVGLLRQMTADADPSVQANAVWSLGWVGDGSDEARLRALVSHRDVAVAGNAAVALGLLEARGKVRASELLCELFDDGRAYVRANALSSLRAVGKRCGDGTRERNLLGLDGSTLVRTRAAQLIWAVSSGEGKADERALRRCLMDDRSGRVALACREPLAGLGSGVDSVVVFVVPDGRTEPQARAPYALVFADGRVRMGLADRRGAVFEASAPRGEVALGVPGMRVR
jgi:HEAT repeat protein